ncbi:family 78 glycoside hydrolase catalytic domain [Aeoliella mucimassa]|uniref:family 78 glycoside hydrolase catalytic domain n=1 Tax=Aeoliella mucimassa TaxID=2527972 RepID=UPI0018D4720F|nr:family 78 glycoside hydrolase catalytic domain [Aeoliella mucimassa]
MANLRCEYLTDPLGIDVLHPRLSWQVQAIDADQRGLKQTTYQLLVATSPELLTPETADLWNSGKVCSPQTQLVEYEGEPLASDTVCYWKVRVTDREGKLSDWSEPARWSMGPQADEWSAKWIGAVAGESDGHSWDPWLRKHVTLTSPAERAELHVASVGYHELYVNGQKVDDSLLEPAVSNHRKRARYVTYDIASLLVEGDNVIGLWLGTSWAAYPLYQSDDKPSLPIVAAQGTVHCQDESTVAITTDASWKIHPSGNRLLGSWMFRNFGGEHQSPTLHIPEWNRVDYDDHDWSAATVYEPQLMVSAEMVERNRAVKTIQAIEIQQVADNEYRADMGVNFAGTLQLDLTGTPGSIIEILSSEYPAEALTHNLRSEVIVDAQGHATFRSRFNYHSGRWITLRGVTSAPQLEDIRGELVRTDFARSGQFRCSDPLLNQIYDTTNWTLENLALGGYLVDCPQRERMGYGGDGHATINTTLMNYNVGAFYTKWNQDWHDTQDDDGFLPHTAPTFWGGGGPGWSGFCVTLPWEVYQQYGDLRILEQSWPVIERWLAFLDAHSENDMLLEYHVDRNGTAPQWSFLADWLWPGSQGIEELDERLFFNSCYWIYNLQTAASIADQLGHEQAAAKYRARADEVRRAVHAKYYDADDHSYSRGMQAPMALALVVDLPPESERPLVWKRLEREIVEVREGHIHAGITGGAMLFKLLMENGRDDLIAMMTSKTDYPSWGHMLDEGATTIWECWEDPVGRRHSALHSSYLYVGAWPLRSLAGITPGEQAGFAEFTLRPAFVPQLDWVEASYDAPTGTIRSAWRRADGKRTLSIEVPANTMAEIYLPTTGEITEGKKPLNNIEDYLEVETADDSTTIYVESGKYEFSWAE